MRKSWIAVFGLIFLFGSIPMPSLSAEAQASQLTISLEEGNVILPNSDVKFVSVGGETVYAVVDCRGKDCLFFSENEGRTWQKVSGYGLPEKEEFISLETSGSEIVALATTTMVYRSRDGGGHFSCLGGPLGLNERNEEISSLAVSGGQILVGVWHPRQDEYPQEGVYLWQGGSEWKPQGMRQIWQGRSYPADVTSVAFSEFGILAVASGDPDDSGGLPEGTYLNMASLGQGTIFGADWNQLAGWPIEIARSSGQSPAEGEILSSKMAWSELDFWGKELYIIYSSRQKVNDDAYRVKLSEGFSVEEVCRLEIPRAPEILSLDSIDYFGTTTSGNLAVGLTTSEGVQVCSLTAAGERFSPPYWDREWLRASEAENCQVAFSSDGTIFAGTSGRASCFARSEGSNLIPISLIDASGGINQLVPSPDFLEDKTIYLNYGERNILKLILTEDYQLAEAQRLLYLAQRLDPEKIRLELDLNQNLFVLEIGTKNFWRASNSLSWKKMETEVELMDIVVVGKVVYAAGEDSMIYCSENAGTSWQQRVSSGIRWLQRLEPGPQGKILIVGGSSKENRSDTISLGWAGEDKALPSIPVTVSYPKGLVVVYSPEDDSVYCGADDQLYRLTMEGEDWEKITEFGRKTTELLISPQGLYAFCKPRVYFSSFPLSTDYQWESLEIEGNWLGCRLIELDEGSNLLFLWDSSKIAVYPHQIPEEEPEEIIPEPVEPLPVEPEPVEPPPTEPEPPPVEPQPVSPVIPWLGWIAIGLVVAFFVIYLPIAHAVTNREGLRVPPRPKL